MAIRKAGVAIRFIWTRGLLLLTDDSRKVSGEVVR